MADLDELAGSHKDSKATWPPKPLVDISQEQVEFKKKSEHLKIIIKTVLWSLCGLATGILLPLGLLLLYSPLGSSPLAHGPVWFHYLSFPIEGCITLYLLKKNRVASISFGCTSIGASLAVALIGYFSSGYDIN